MSFPKKPLYFTKMVYLAGPYTAPDDAGREANVRRAEDAARAVFRSGNMPIYTHRGYHPFFGEFPESRFIELGKSLLVRCDCVWIYCSPEEAGLSRGTVGEINEAYKSGVPYGYVLETVLADCGGGFMKPGAGYLSTE